MVNLAGGEHATQLWALEHQMPYLVTVAALLGAWYSRTPDRRRHDRSVEEPAHEVDRPSIRAQDPRPELAVRDLYSRR